MMMEYGLEGNDLGSAVLNTGGSEKDIQTRIGKANAVFGRLENVWHNKRLGIGVEIWLYESLVLFTLRYDAETWSVTVANMKQLEAGHHRWQCWILKVTRRDKI